MAVIPAKAGIHERRRAQFSRNRVHGSRIKSGMTKSGIPDDDKLGIISEIR
jgi:hypothetical protein